MIVRGIGGLSYRGRMAAGFRIIPVSQTPWGDVVQVFGTRGDPAGCWCQYFKITNAEFTSAQRPGGDRARLASKLREQAYVDGPGPGLIAYSDGEPAGWIAVEPRACTPRIFNSKISMSGRREPDDDDSVWAITCLVVRVGFRRRGLGAALVLAAVEQAVGGGARVIEGYPVETAGTARSSSADLYHGTVSMFLDAGFEVVARPSDRRAVVRLEPSRS